VRCAPRTECIQAHSSSSARKQSSTAAAYSTQTTQSHHILDMHDYLRPTPAGWSLRARVYLRSCLNTSLNTFESPLLKVRIYAFTRSRYSDRPVCHTRRDGVVAAFTQRQHSGRASGSVGRTQFTVGTVTTQLVVMITGRRRLSATVRVNGATCR
jgi:hypothetical protein